jgi:hypothetical protein
MKLFDALYYSIYRFGRSIGQPHLQAKACAGNFLPFFFMMAGFCLYVIFASKWSPSILPTKSFKPEFVALGIGVLIVSYIIYVKRGRGQRIISKYEQLKDQKRYIWFGAIFTAVAVSSPVWLYLVWRAVL